MTSVLSVWRSNRCLPQRQTSRLHCCENASDAITHANALKPSLILQDLVMPGIDGLTLVDRFRQNASTARTPIIVLSGNEDAGSRSRSLAAGANDYLVKLPAKDELVACLRKHADTGTPPETPLPGHSASAGDGESDQTLDLEVIALFCEPTSGGRLSTFARGLIDQFIGGGRVARHDAQRCDAFSGRRAPEKHRSQPQGQFHDRGSETVGRTLQTTRGSPRQASRQAGVPDTHGGDR